MTTPDRISWVTGSDQEWKTLTDGLVSAGTFTRLNDDLKPNSFHCASNPSDVARVEDRTFICSVDQKDAGPTNNWMAPDQMKALMKDLYRGSMAGRTMYVIPFVMGRLNAEDPKFGVEITDSAYVVVSMRVMALCGTGVLNRIEELDSQFVPALHSVGAPLKSGEKDVAWPCNETKYIVQFPEERMIWSYGSGYGGNALLCKKCYSLRIASVIARDEGWLAEHMLILKLTSPEKETHYITAAFPSACGKTNMAMLSPTVPGWEAQTLGDDIAWMRFGKDGRLYAVNPEAGFFAVAPGTSRKSNPNMVDTVGRNTIYTNVALGPDRRPWWEGHDEPAPEGLLDWRGNPWTPGQGSPAAHPNSRLTAPARQCPGLSPRFDDPQGVPISAILFGGRRARVAPLVFQAFDWRHGVFLGAAMGSETTAAATGDIGVVRRDPMAMLPFCGYNMADYFAHWLRMGMKSDEAPGIFHVNWFQTGPDGRFLWPGFGENLRVLRWILGRVRGEAAAVRSAIGLLPAPGSLDLSGLDLPETASRKLFSVDREAWIAEAAELKTFFSRFGERLPDALLDERERLEHRLRVEISPA